MESDIGHFMVSWNRCWRGLGAVGEPELIGRDLLNRYAEHHRHYHTTQHLGECLSWFEQCQELAARPAEVEAALWFHDAVYALQGIDNEAESAALARSALDSAGVDAGSIERMAELILDTRHQTRPGTSDGQLLTDIDLAILGAPALRFAEYEAQIRAEYAFVPEEIFCQKRRGILESFLARKRIYNTDFFHDALESQARQNLSLAVGLQ